MPAPVNTVVFETTSSASTSPQALPPAAPPQAPLEPTPQSSLPAVTTPGSPSQAQASTEQIQAQLDAALKNSGIKTEIENEKSGLVIVRFVQADTGQVILQMPPQGVLDLVASMDKQPEQSMLSGNIVDTNG